MALNIRNTDVERERSNRPLIDELEEIAKQCASLPILDRRSVDEILGYDENGLPSWDNARAA